jgi:hypothetical protein
MAPKISSYAVCILLPPWISDGLGNSRKCQKWWVWFQRLGHKRDRFLLSFFCSLWKKPSVFSILGKDLHGGKPWPSVNSNNWPGLGTTIPTADPLVPAQSSNGSSLLRDPDLGWLNQATLEFLGPSIGGRGQMNIVVSSH